MDCEKLLCGDNSLMKDVMMCINNNTKGISFIVDCDHKLIGLMTDGDIRRALLDGAGLNEPRS